MADQNDREFSPATAWDRVGQFLQDSAAVGLAIAQRNQELWTRVSTNLRSNQYKPESMTADAAAAMSTALDNLDDMWQLLTRPPDRERVATTLPSIFLRFQETDGVWSNPDPVWIRVPFWDRANLPRQADIHLDGAKAAVKKLASALRAELVGNSYRLEVADARGLAPGMYVGIVAIGDRPLANLRIVVEDKAS
jgi:hypothetical protein